MRVVSAQEAGARLRRSVRVRQRWVPQAVRTLGESQRVVQLRVVQLRAALPLVELLQLEEQLRAVPRGPAERGTGSRWRGRRAR